MDRLDADMSVGLGSSASLVRAGIAHRGIHGGVAQVSAIALPLATGAALVVAIVGGVPLQTAALTTVGLGTVAWIALLRRSTPAARRWFGERIWIGLGAGVLATLAYDATRYGVVAAMSWSFDPFHALPAFGYGLLGRSASEGAAWIAGTLFHYANGIGFAVAYLLTVDRPRIGTAIIWAAVLEILMLGLYPSWLGIPLAGELAPVSIAGHAAWGTTLALVGGRLVRRAST